MPDDKPDETRHPRQKAISPQLRRFLGPGRSLHDQPGSPEGEGEKRSRPDFAAEREVDPRLDPTGAGYAFPQKLMSLFANRAVVLIFGGLFILLATFYVGKKFDSWKYRVATLRTQQRLSDMIPDKFQGLTANELVEQALSAQRLGNWQEAAERLIAAKRKNLAYRGILFRVGKLYYDQGDFATADRMFERAVAFGENVDLASFLRGLISVGRGNYPAAERFFETAANAEPFVSVYTYQWAETLRHDHEPAESIPIYERALRRYDTEQDRTVCNFKIRMAMVEAGQTTPLSVDIDAKQQTGPLPVDWLMTAAALRIREGKMSEAVPLIERARNADQVNLYSLFATCVGDMFFASAAAKDPEIAQACRIQAAPALPGRR